MIPKFDHPDKRVLFSTRRENIVAQQAKEVHNAKPRNKANQGRWASKDPELGTHGFGSE
jgi:hypothetical protein